MQKRTAQAGIAVFSLLLAFAGFVGCGDRKAGTVNVVGSTSVQPFAEMLAQAFKLAHADLNVEVQGGGSTAGLQAVTEGLADIGSCSRSLKPEETGFTPIIIARDGLAIVVNPSNPVLGLSLAQVKDIFTGTATNWNQVGGQDGKITLISREEGSGTREAFTHLILGDARISREAMIQESNGAVKELVKNDPAAIGYMSLGLIHGELKALDVDGVPATHGEVISGRYPLVRPFLFVTRGTVKPEAKRFIDFVLSPDGQKILAKEGLVGN